MATYEVRNSEGLFIGSYDNLADARQTAVWEFGPDADINDMDADGRALIWRNSEESQDDDGKRACGVIVRLEA